jgi:NADH dehydrogenase
MNGRRITVFGGSGFIGRHLVRRLAARDWIVRAAVRDPVRAEFLKPMGGVGQIVPIRASITDDRAVQAAVAGADAVVNLVGILYERPGRTFQQIHAEAPGRLARAAAAAGVRRLVHVSAIGADPAAEAAYARTKGAGEAAVRAAFPAATIMRPSVVFGPEDGLFNRFAAMAKLSPFLPLIGGGRTKFQPVYVGNVAAAIERALEDAACQGKTYELGGPRIYTFREMMEVLLAEIGRHRRLLDVPWRWAELQGAILEKLPLPPPLTRDQVLLLKHDNVVGPGALTLADLGITPTALEVILPTYLDRFRRHGRFAVTRVV